MYLMFVQLKLISYQAFLFSIQTTFRYNVRTKSSFFYYCNIIECYPTTNELCSIADCSKPGAVDLCPRECYQGIVFLAQQYKKLE